MSEAAEGPPAPSEADLAGPVIAELITAELGTVRAATTSLQSRGLAVISSAGTLVTLLFGLSALVTKAQNFALPAGTKLPLLLAAALLVLAAVAGIATNAPRRRNAMALEKLVPLIETPLWDAKAKKAKQEVARTQLAIARGESEINGRIARFLLVGIILEIAGVACVMWAIAALILTG